MNWQIETAHTAVIGIKFREFHARMAVGIPDNRFLRDLSTFLSEYSSDFAHMEIDTQEYKGYIGISSKTKKWDPNMRSSVKLASVVIDL